MGGWLTAVPRISRLVLDHSLASFCVRHFEIEGCYVSTMNIVHIALGRRN